MRLTVGPTAAALLLDGALSRSPPPVGLFGSRSLPPEVVEIYDGFYEASERERAKGAPAKPPISQVAPLWTALVKAYGTEELALKAARQNGQIINPLYTSSASLITDSKAGLVIAMGSEEDALEIMLKNPAILQCGMGIRTQPADEIRRFAIARALFDSVPPQASLAALSVTILAALANIALKDSDVASVQQTLTVLRPAVGAIGAAIFLATVGNAGRSQRDMMKAQSDPEE